MCLRVCFACVRFCFGGLFFAPARVAFSRLCTNEALGTPPGLNPLFLYLHGEGMPNPPALPRPLPQPLVLASMQPRVFVRQCIICLATTSTGERGASSCPSPRPGPSPSPPPGATAAPPRFTSPCHSARNSQKKKDRIARTPTPLTLQRPPTPSTTSREAIKPSVLLTCISLNIVNPRRAHPSSLPHPPPFPPFPAVLFVSV